MGGDLVPDQLGGQSPLLEEVEDRTKFYNFVRDDIAKNMKARGVIVVTELPFTGVNGVTAIADVVFMVPGRGVAFIDVKTGEVRHLRTTKGWSILCWFSAVMRIRLTPEFRNLGSASAISCLPSQDTSSMHLSLVLNT